LAGLTGTSQPLHRRRDGAGSRKSAVFAATTAPLLDAERTLVEQAKPRIVEAKLARRVAERDAERKADTATDTSDPQARADALAEAAGAALDADAIRIAALPRLVADDITPEAAASLLAEQGGRLAVLSAEGGIFATMAGRYSCGVPSLEVFLKGHAGDLLRVDCAVRVGARLDEVAHVVGPGNVGGDEGGGASRVADELDRLLAVRAAALEVADDHERALAGVGEGRRPADASRASRDQACLGCQLVLCSFSWAFGVEGGGEAVGESPRVS
jgi:hypothetical protein